MQISDRLVSVEFGIYADSTGHITGMEVDIIFDIEDIMVLYDIKGFEAILDEIEIPEEVDHYLVTKDILILTVESAEYDTTVREMLEIAKAFSDSIKKLLKQW